jgi:hypothetical protein
MLSVEPEVPEVPTYVLYVLVYDLCVPLHANSEGRKYVQSHSVLLRCEVEAFARVTVKDMAHNICVSLG